MSDPHPTDLDDEMPGDPFFREEEVQRDMGEPYERIALGSPLKRRMFELLYHPYFEFFIFFLIILSVVIMVFEVLHPDGEHTGLLSVLDHQVGEDFAPTLFFWLDMSFTSTFLVEYLLKLWIAPHKWTFVRRNWIDLLAVLPILRVFRLGRAVRLLRLFRLLRLVRIGAYLQQYVDAMNRRTSSRTVENEIILVYLLFSLVFGTVGILVFEKGHNDGFETLGDGLWWCVVTLTTVGYGDISPITTGGKLVAGVVMFIGLTFWALLTGTVSSIIIEHAKQNEGESIMVSTLTGHVIVCGWNQTGERLVHDITVAVPDMHVVVVQQDKDILRIVNPTVHYLYEDPTTLQGLQHSRVKHARVAVVLADERGGRAQQDVDARSILTALAIERTNPEVHTIVELLNADNVFHVRNAGVDEVIVAGEYMGGMLSQSVQFPGLSDVFGSIFGVGEGVMMRQIRLPGELNGKTFAEASHYLLQHNQGIAVGYRRAGELRMTPAASEALLTRDVLIVMRSVEG